jgi:hypothetical protein
LKRLTLNGSWTVQFVPNGAYEIDRNALAVVIGHSTASAAEIVFADETGPFACKKAGKYRWALRAKKLTMKAVQDSCTRAPHRADVARPDQAVATERLPCPPPEPTDAAP